MFVKIKMEPQTSAAYENLKDTQYISIEDDATITTLKMQIEKYVNIAAGKQEIRTLTTSFGNSRKVKELCDNQCSSLMLYAYRNDIYASEEPSFICFLQILTNEVGKKLREMENQQSTLSVSSAFRSLPSGMLIAVSDTDSSESESDSESNSEDENSDSSNGSLSSSGQKKRKLIQNQKVEQKRRKVAHVMDKFSPTLCQYLEEFPKSNKNSSAGDESNSESSSGTESDDSRPSKCQSKTNNFQVEKDTSVEANHSKSCPILDKATPRTVELLESEQLSKDNIKEATKGINTTVITSTTSTSVQVEAKKIPSSIPVITKISSTTHELQHPCYRISPEKRQFTLCIKTDKSGVIQKDEFKSFLEWIFERFLTCENAHQLHFLHQSPITHHEGKVWIACMNQETCEWISSSISQYNLHSYIVEPLMDANRGYIVEVVVPKVVSKVNNFLDIFKLLEKQNPGLRTLYWCLSNRRILMANDDDYIEKAVSSFCTNELFSLWIDTESKEFLDGVQQKLKYCFWEVVFQIVNK